ncbi:alpha/beta hydrolase [Sinomonas sp. ASV322]|uniref:alpha/beta hydrolase n=1 Tax=Sinomonas sp. ASV322 TaxID=3041920 RepID=UPI0027DC28D7|nr:alpha/beta hydrolase [Sinomonas sp. ASV322]MDQ4502474.1 alpha/beta hydrolase [Sinomonas sp. ASV322]
MSAAPSAGTSTGIPPTDALWRAMGPTRLLDCGMDYADLLGLQRLTGEGVAWDDAAEQLGSQRMATGREAESAGHAVTAVQSYRAGAACFLFAQMAHSFDVPRKRALYALFDQAVASAGRLQARTWERVEVPFGAGRMFGWLVAPDAPVRGTVVVFGGQSGWGAAYLRQADELNRRGLAALLAEGPGQGATRLEGGVLLDVDVRAAYSAFVGEVLARGMGPGVGLWGNSMGGLYAATTAASDARVGAVCVNGAPARPVLLPFRAFREQAFAMLGSDDPSTVQDNFDRLALMRGDRIECPLLVLHGGADPLISLEDQQPFLDAASDGTLRVWDDGEHTIYNHSTERTASVADWFADVLSREGETEA